MAALALEDAPYVIFDVETTGASAGKGGGITEIGALKLVRGPGGGRVRDAREPRAQDRPVRRPPDGHHRPHGRRRPARLGGHAPLRGVRRGLRAWWATTSSSTARSSRRRAAGCRCRTPPSTPSSSPAASCRARALPPERARQPLRGAPGPEPPGARRRLGDDGGVPEAPQAPAFGGGAERRGGGYHPRREGQDQAAEAAPRRGRPEHAGRLLLRGQEGRGPLRRQGEGPEGARPDVLQRGDGRRKVGRLVEEVAEVEVKETESELHALILEAREIKRLLPRYNSVGRDDKASWFIRLDTNEPYPMPARVTENAPEDGVVHIGPYRSASVLDTCMEALGRIFPLKRCSGDGEACFYGQMGRCAPCAGMGEEEYRREVVDEIVALLRGEGGEEHLQALVRERKRLAQALEFEAAARLRDLIAGIDRVRLARSVVSGEGAQAVVAPSTEPGVIEVFVLSEGRLVSHRGFEAGDAAGLDAVRRGGAGAAAGPAGLRQRGLQRGPDRRRLPPAQVRGGRGRAAGGGRGPGQGGREGRRGGGGARGPASLMKAPGFGSPPSEAFRFRGAGSWVRISRSRVPGAATRRGDPGRFAGYRPPPLKPGA